MVVRWVGLAAVGAALLGACGSSNSSSGLNCVTACSGPAPSCGLVGICSNDGRSYEILCAASGCECSTRNAGGVTHDKNVLFESDFCPWGNDDTNCEVQSEQALANASRACGWGL
ncbi:MAG TPA: hypothetical protein VNO21_14015 [Polyangiaceae bacterium]|nr:hypothetical protein [Polyangiaceae bacterium]